MKSLEIVLASVIVFSSGAFFLSAYSEESNSMIIGGHGLWKWHDRRKYPDNYVG